MKTLQESIIGRKGSLARFTKDMLKPGYIYDNIPTWMPISSYSKNMECPEDHKFDIIEVYPIKAKPDFLTQNQLKDLIKGVKPIRINQ